MLGCGASGECCCGAVRFVTAGYIKRKRERAHALANAFADLGDAQDVPLDSDETTKHADLGLWLQSCKHAFESVHASKTPNDTTLPYERECVEGNNATCPQDQSTHMYKMHKHFVCAHCLMAAEYSIGVSGGMHCICRTFANALRALVGWHIAVR